MKEKICNVLQFIFGWGIFISLFVGSLTFIGYLVALIIGGELAQSICFVIYKKIIPVLIYISTISVIIGLIKMYIKGEVALSSKK